MHAASKETQMPWFWLRRRVKWWYGRAGFRLGLDQLLLTDKYLSLLETFKNCVYISYVCFLITVYLRWCWQSYKQLPSLHDVLFLAESQHERHGFPSSPCYIALCRNYRKATPGHLPPAIHHSFAKPASAKVTTTNMKQKNTRYSAFFRLSQAPCTALQGACACLLRIVAVRLGCATQLARIENHSCPSQRFGLPVSWDSCECATCHSCYF